MQTLCHATNWVLHHKATFLPRLLSTTSGLPSVLFQLSANIFVLQNISSDSWPYLPWLSALGEAGQQLKDKTEQWLPTSQDQMMQEEAVYKLPSRAA